MYEAMETFSEEEEIEEEWKDMNKEQLSEIEYTDLIPTIQDNISDISSKIVKPTIVEQDDDNPWLAVKEEYIRKDLRENKEESSPSF